MHKLVLIRHGESTWNLENRFTGWTDVDLTPTGIEQAIQAAIAGDFTPFHRLDAALHAPFEQHAEWDDLALPPEQSERVTRTFCGT